MRPFALGAIPCRSLPDPRLSFTKLETTYSIFPYSQIPLKFLPLCNNSQTIFSGTYKSFICCVNNNGGSRNCLWKLTLRLRSCKGRCGLIAQSMYFPYPYPLLPVMMVTMHICPRSGRQGGAAQVQAVKPCTGQGEAWQHNVM